MRLHELIQQQAQQCVKCAVCLPSCPTYVQTHREGHSPRGRIALMEALANDSLSLDQHSQNYLDHCLTCRACEAVCPSKVPYSALIDETRALIQEKNSTIVYLPWWIDQISQSKKIQAFLRTSLRLFGVVAVKLGQSFRRTRFYHLLYAATQVLGWDKLANLSLKGILVNTQQKQSISFPSSGLPATFSPEEGGKEGKKLFPRVGLFRGCVSNILETQLLETAATLLQQLGYDVIQPQSQTCCGALHLHQGQPAVTQSLAQQNVQAFRDCDTILFLNSGCGLTLSEYASHPLLNTETANPPFMAKDILDFIADHIEHHGWPETLTVKFPDKRYALHIPCSQKNGLKTHGAARLLKLMPNLDLLPIADGQTQGCCGGAGIYFWQHAEMAQQLGQNCLQTLTMDQPDVILSTNVGCRLQLSMQSTQPFGEETMCIPILHPLQILQ